MPKEAQKESCAATWTKGRVIPETQETDSSAEGNDSEIKNEELSRLEEIKQESLPLFEAELRTVKIPNQTGHTSLMDIPCTFNMKNLNLSDVVVGKLRTSVSSNFLVFTAENVSACISSFPWSISSKFGETTGYGSAQLKNCFFQFTFEIDVSGGSPAVSAVGVLVDVEKVDFTVEKTSSTNVMGMQFLSSIISILNQQILLWTRDAMETILKQHFCDQMKAILIDLCNRYLIDIPDASEPEAVCSPDDNQTQQQVSEVLLAFDNTRDMIARVLNENEQLRSRNQFLEQEVVRLQNLLSAHKKLT